MISTGGFAPWLLPPLDSSPAVRSRRVNGTASTSGPAPPDGGNVPTEGRFVVGGVALDHGISGGLLVGEHVDGVLTYRGMVTWGVPPEWLSDLATSPLMRATSPFVDLPGQPGIIWLEPRITVEISYEPSERGHLRAATLRGMGLDVDED